MKSHVCIFLSGTHELIGTHVESQALVLSKKFIRYGHILRIVCVEKVKKKVRPGYEKANEGFCFT